MPAPELPLGSIGQISPSGLAKQIFEETAKTTVADKVANRVLGRSGGPRHKRTQSSRLQSQVQKLYSGSHYFRNSETLIETIHLIEGPVGAGKSTFSGKLSLMHKAPHLNLDEWMVTLFSPDRPETNFIDWYSDRKSRCIQQIWEVSCELLENGTSVVLELGLVERADRDNFYHRVAGTNYDLQVYLIDTPLEIRRQRVKERNAKKSDTYKMEVSDEMFDLANSFWEEPTETELRERNIRVVSTT